MLRDFGISWESLLIFLDPDYRARENNQDLRNKKLTNISYSKNVHTQVQGFIGALDRLKFKWCGYNIMSGMDKHVCKKQLR